MYYYYYYSPGLASYFFHMLSLTIKSILMPSISFSLKCDRTYGTAQALVDGTAVAFLDKTDGSDLEITKST